MEEKKNNAVEKTENAIKRSNDKKNGEDARRERAIKQQRVRAERERIRAEKRIELARIKAQKQAERERAMANAERERIRLKAELEHKKMEKRAKRDELKRRHRQENKKRRHGFGGWIVATVTLGVASVLLASALTFMMVNPSTNGDLLEAGYSKSFYDTIEQVDNIDLNLSKILVTKDSGAMQKYLVDTAINSELAENDFQQLPIHDESKFFTTKLINQIGDYSKYLNNKIINGDTLTSSDMQNLVTLYKANKKLKESLNRISGNLSGDYSFDSLLKASENDPILLEFNSLQNMSVDFPELIYDGPFSDGLDSREIKGLKGSEITKAKAEETFQKIFKDYPLEDVKCVGETNSNMPCYNVQASVGDEELYAQISKVGGHLIMFDCAGNCESQAFDSSDCIETALKFIENQNVKDMKPVWINLANNVYTINFAVEDAGVIVYSDLIKVRVCSNTNKVIGYESTGYYMNHHERTIPSAKLSEEKAMASVSDHIEVQSARLALVPIGNSSEKLCYEFSGESEGEIYYVYIDAVSGRQVEMFKVISSSNGELLM
ncbi:MAG: hypothetical protein E7369_03610 [Clostridiales bacterium]|nr:hypothetical protein [Clostridiales bacterium]